MVVKVGNDRNRIFWPETRKKVKSSFGFQEPECIFKIPLPVYPELACLFKNPVSVNSSQNQQTKFWLKPEYNWILKLFKSNFLNVFGFSNQFEIFNFHYVYKEYIFGLVWFQNFKSLFYYSVLY